MNDATSAPVPVAIRSARPDDFPTLQEMEIAAGRAFAEIGMDMVAASDPFSIEELAAYQGVGHAWVAIDDEDRPVAYLVVAIVAGNAHIDQISVHPESARRGIGRALIEHIASWSCEHGLPAITLTTFRDVAWNGPYYERCGFRFLPSGEVTPELAAIRSHEADIGFDQWPRVCMRRDLT